MDPRELAVMQACMHALEGIVSELGLLRKQVEKLDRTVGKLNEMPTEATYEEPNKD